MRGTQGHKHAKVIVIGLDGLNGIQTARIFAAYKIPVIGIAEDPKHYCSRTNVCERKIFTNTHTEELIETLEKLGPTLEEKAVLVPCTDMTVMQVSKHRDRLAEWYHVVLPPHETMVMMMDKVKFYTHSIEKGLPIPATRFINSQEDAEKAAAELTFPCVLKPPMSSIPEWEKNSFLKAYQASTPEELLEIYALAKNWSKNLIVQEWVVGPDTNLYSCNCYLNRESEVLVTFVARKLRQWPPITGESSLGEECRNDTVLEETIRLFQSVKHYGLGYVEMKQDVRTGKYFILEPNPGRPTGRSSIAEAGGVELLYTMYCDVLGLPLPENRTQKYIGAKWISLRRDLQSAFYHWRKDELTFKEWRRTMRGKKMEAIFSWKDPKPFICDLLRCLQLFSKREEREKRLVR